jgi:hypothetical protein
VKEGLLEIGTRGEEGRDWQPHILVFTEDVERRSRLLRFAGWMTGGTGIITAVQLVEGDGTSVRTQQRCNEMRTTLRDEIAHEQLDAFPLVVASADLGVAAAALVQAWGVGPIQANTILLNWMDVRGSADPAATWAYARMLRSAVLLRRNLIVLDADAPEFERLARLAPDERRIDVWWWDDPSSALALLLAYLMTRTDFWDEASVRLLVPTVAGDEIGAAGRVRERLEEVRIHAECEILPGADSKTLVARSLESAVVCLPLRAVGPRLVDPLGTPIEELLPELPVVALVGAVEDVALVEEGSSKSDAGDQPAVGRRDTESR